MQRRAIRRYRKNPGADLNLGQPNWATLGRAIQIAYRPSRRAERNRAQDQNQGAASGPGLAGTTPLALAGSTRWTNLTHSRF